MEHLRTAYSPVARSWNKGAYVKAAGQAVLCTVAEVALAVGKVGLPIIGALGGVLACCTPFTFSMAEGIVGGGIMLGQAIGAPISALGVGILKLAGNEGVSLEKHAKIHKWGVIAG